MTVTDSPLNQYLVADAQAVVDAVTLDENGKMIGTMWQGGNGGLLSRDTLKAVDRLRLTLARVKAATHDAMKAQGKRE